jgi:monoamine oxidase
VAIIGAGIAGLTAARRLAGSGRSVQIFEARQRSGGRAWSPTLQGAALDLGATWVWDSERSIHALLSELGIPTFPHFQDGLDVLDSSPLQRGRFPRSTVPERRIVGGVQRITDALSDGAPIAYGTEVRALEPAGDGVRVVTGGGGIHARHVLAALPPSLVARQLLSADPEAARILARVPVWMGDIAKVVAVFEHRFWVEQGWSGRGASARGPMVEIHDLSGVDGTPACLFGFVPQALGGPDLEERVRAQLQRMFGAAAVPVHVAIQAWWTEPYTTEPDPDPDPRLFGHPLLREPFLNRALHLIGCETSGVSPGHLNGAVERANTVSAALQSAAS